MKLDVEVLQRKLELRLQEKKVLENEVDRLRKKVQEMTSAIKTMPADKWYIRYLMGANASLERECDRRQLIINQYQKHYEKFGRFYADLEEKLGIHRELPVSDETVV